MPQVIEIADLAAPELEVYARLTEGQLKNRAEPEKGLFIAESPKVIDRALDAGYEPVSLLMERKHVDGQARDIVARCGDVPVYTSELSVLKELTGFPLTRGVLCAMRRKPLPTAEAVCAGARRVAVLEEVVNPTNVGAIFRSAAALGMDAVLLTPGSCDPLYRRAVARCSKSPGPFSEKRWGTGRIPAWIGSARSASGPPRWRSRTTRCRSTIPRSPRRKSWR